MSTQEVEITRADTDVVAFDWDGTLVDSVNPKLLHNQEIARQFGQKLSIEEVRRIWSGASDFPELMLKLTGCHDHSRIMSVIKEGYEDPSFVKRPFDEFDVAEVVRQVRRLGFYTALLTSATREILRADEQILGLDVGELFDFTQTSDENLHKKPSGKFFDTLINLLSITNSSRVVYVGDEIKDGLAARNAGIGFVGVQTGMATSEEFANMGFASVLNASDIEFRSEKS